MSSNLFLIAMLLLAALAYWVQHALTNTTKDKVEKMLEEIKKKQFNVSQYLICEDAVKGFIIAVDNDKKQVAFSYCFNNKTWAELYNAEDLIECEVVEDGNSISKTSRSNQLARTVVGGALFGGVGAIIGGVTAKTKTKQTISKIILRITVNKVSAPIKEIIFLNKEVDKSSATYRLASQQANHWNGIFKALMSASNN